MARFAVICYILFGLSNLRVTVCPLPLPPPSLKRRRRGIGKRGRKSKRERKRIRKGKGWRVGCLDPGWKLLRQGGKRGEDGALRLHSSANRGIFVRFLFENKTLPTTPGASKGGEGEMRRLKWIGFVRIYGVYVSTTNALISASRRRFSSPSILRLCERNLRFFAKL